MCLTTLCCHPMRVTTRHMRVGYADWQRHEQSVGDAARRAALPFGAHWRAFESLLRDCRARRPGEATCPDLGLEPRTRRPAPHAFGPHIGTGACRATTGGTAPRRWSPKARRAARRARRPTRTRSPACPATVRWRAPSHARRASVTCWWRGGGGGGARPQRRSVRRGGRAQGGAARGETTTTSSASSASAAPPPSLCTTG